MKLARLSLLSWLAVPALADDLYGVVVDRQAPCVPTTTTTFTTTTVTSHVTLASNLTFRQTNFWTYTSISNLPEVTSFLPQQATTTITDVAFTTLTPISTTTPNTTTTTIGTTFSNVFTTLCDPSVVVPTFITSVTVVPFSTVTQAFPLTTLRSTVSRATLLTSLRSETSNITIRSTGALRTNTIPPQTTVLLASRVELQSGVVSTRTLGTPSTSFATQTSVGNECGAVTVVGTVAVTVEVGHVVATAEYYNVDIFNEFVVVGQSVVTILVAVRPVLAVLDTIRATVAMVLQFRVIMLSKSVVTLVQQC